MNIEIITDAGRLDVGLIHRFLSEETRWARGIARAMVERSIANSLCFGAFAEGVQVGFARVVSDRATFAYLCDVFVLPAWRRRGVGRRIVEAALGHPELQGLRRFALTARDAAPLYAGCGFAVNPGPHVWMERHNPTVHLQEQAV